MSNSFEYQTNGSLTNSLGMAKSMRSVDDDDYDVPEEGEESENGSENGINVRISVISEVESIPSTIQFSQEPFKTFRHKARKLILELWPDLDSADLDIEYMQGGTYNRVIGVTFLEPRPKYSFIPFKSVQNFIGKCMDLGGKNRRVTDRYVLRVPRSPRNAGVPMAYDITTLAYAKRQFSVGIPEVVTYDSTCGNGLGQAYILQARVPGVPLSQLWPTLNLRQKKSAARSISHLIIKLYKIRNPCAGIISPGNTGIDLSGIPKLEQMPVPCSFAKVGTDGARTAPAYPQTTRDFLISLCERQRQYAKEAGELPFNRIWDRLIAMVNRLYDLGFLPDDDFFHFYHGDLYPRNLLFEVVDDANVRLTGILDWDLAVFAPKFMITRPPFYLWNDEDSHDEDEDAAMLQPGDAENTELKRVFETAVGSEFAKWASGKEYVLMRKMYRILTQGVLSGADEYRAEETLLEFEILHPMPK